MRQSVLMKLTLLAGLACNATAIGQTFSFELVLDNDPRLAAMGVNLGANTLLPGPSATAVGLTLIGRVTTQGTQPNVGIVRFGGGGSRTAPLSIFYHTDAYSNQTGPNWTSASLALSRGNIDSNTSPTAPRGLMRYVQPANYSGAGEQAQTIDYRLFVGGNNPNRNSARTNGFIESVSNDHQPTNNVYADYAGTGVNSNNYNGWVGVNLFGDYDGTLPANAANTYPNTPGSAAILSVVASRTPLQTAYDASGDSIPTIVNYGGRANAGNGGNILIPGSDQDPSVAGVQSTWQAMYRLVFTPRPGEDAGLGVGGLRNVTVTAEGFGTGVESVFQTGDQCFMSLSSVQRSFSTSLTFTVPSPSVGAVLVFAFVVDRRRRRTATV